jgi:hypothetical protein
MMEEEEEEEEEEEKEEKQEGHHQHHQLIFIPAFSRTLRASATSLKMKRESR